MRGENESLTVEREEQTTGEKIGGC